MAVLSNAQSLLFVTVWTERVKASDPTVTAPLKDWLGHQQLGQAKASVTEAVVSSRGVVTHTVGDVTLCSFAQPKAALEAATRIQRRLAQIAASSSTMVVKARIALAHGPVRIIAGRISGEPVNVAGMLLEKCPPGEVLVDKTLLDAAGISPGEGFELFPRAEGATAYRVLARAEATQPPDPGAAPQAAVGATPPKPSGEAPAAPSARAPVAEPAAPTPTTKPKRGLVLSFKGAEYRFRATDGDIELGRGPDNHVIVPLPYVSRKHARIVWREHGLPCLINLSRNGTRVRFGSGKEATCEGELPLEDSGVIVLCGTFGVVTGPDELVTFRLTAE
ncbi:MAG: FHA domain-containing protein [Pseudomonadota bacterium]